MAKDESLGRKRRVQINIGLSEYEEEAIKRRAARNGESITETVLRSTVYADEVTAPCSDELRSVASALSEICVQLGQIRVLADEIAKNRRSIVTQEAVKSLGDLTSGLADRVASTLVDASEAVGETTLQRR